MNPKVITKFGCGEQGNLPLVSIAMSLDTWEYVVDHLPNDDWVTKDIARHCSEIIKDQFPMIFMKAEK